MKIIKSSNMSDFKMNKLAALINMAVIGTVGATSAIAAESNKKVAEKEIEVIHAVGIRGGVIAGLEVKRESDVMLDAISAEDMGKFPDANLAEALQRIPDVAIDRDGGEGRYVTIRGLGPEFNSVLFNGRRMATTENTRAFSFDTIASDMVSEMHVYKTQGAALREGGIGGTVDVRTARPLSLDGLTIRGTLKGLYDDNAESTDPQASLIVSNTFNDDKFGALLGLTYQERNNRTYSTNTGSIRTKGVFTQRDPWAYTNLGYADDEGRGLFRPVELNRSVKDESRERFGINGVLQFQPTDDLDITVDYVYSKFDVKSRDNIASNWFWTVDAPKSQADNLSPSERDRILAHSLTEVDENGVLTRFSHGMGFVDGNGNPSATAQAYNRSDTFRPTESQLLGFNVNYSLNDDITLTVDGAWSKAETDNKGDNRRRSLETNVQGGVVVDLSGDVPYIEQGLDTLVAVPENAQYLQIRRQFDYGNDNSAENYELRADLDIVMNDSLIVRTGVSFESSEKTSADYMTPNDVQTMYHQVAGGFFLTPDAYSQVVDGIISVDSTKLGQPAETNNDIFAIGTGLDAYMNDPATLAAVLAQDPGSKDRYDAFIKNGGFSAVETGDSWTVDEQVSSFYVEANYDFLIGDLESVLTGGLRYTNTKITGTGLSRVITDIVEITCPTPQEIACLEPTYANGQGADGLSLETVDNSYDNFLPSLNLKVDLSDDMILRLGASETLTRPYLEDMAPKFRPTTIQQDVRSASSSNSALTPYTAFNLDASFEWYFGEGSLLGLTAYKKDVDDFIVRGQVDNVTVESIASSQYQDFTVNMPVNGESVSITGATFNLVQTFESGLGYQFNYTYTDSDKEFDGTSFDETNVAIPGLGNSMNIVGFYESGPLEMRVAYNWRDKFLSDAQYSSGYGWGEEFSEPVFTKEYYQIDARVSYEVSEDIDVFLEGINLTNESQSKHGRFTNVFVSQANYGARYTFGIAASF